MVESEIWLIQFDIPDVVDMSLTDSITAPVTGSWGLPAWTANVPNPWTGEGALGGVSIDPSCVMV